MAKHRMNLFQRKAFDRLSLIQHHLAGLKAGLEEDDLGTSVGASNALIEEVAEVRSLVAAWYNDLTEHRRRRARQKYAVRRG